MVVHIIFGDESNTKFFMKHFIEFFMIEGNEANRVRFVTEKRSDFIFKAPFKIFSSEFDNILFFLADHFGMNDRTIRRSFFGQWKERGKIKTLKILKRTELQYNGVKQVGEFPIDVIRRGVAEVMSRKTSRAREEALKDIETERRVIEQAERLGEGKLDEEEKERRKAELRKQKGEPTVREDIRDNFPVFEEIPEVADYIAKISPKIGTWKDRIGTMKQFYRWLVDTYGENKSFQEEGQEIFLPRDWRPEKFEEYLNSDIKQRYAKQMETTAIIRFHLLIESKFNKLSLEFKTRDVLVMDFDKKTPLFLTEGQRFNLQEIAMKATKEGGNQWITKGEFQPTHRFHYCDLKEFRSVMTVIENLETRLTQKDGAQELVQKLSDLDEDGKPIPILTKKKDGSFNIRIPKKIVTLSLKAETMARARPINMKWNQDIKERWMAFISYLFISAHRRGHHFKQIKVINPITKATIDTFKKEPITGANNVRWEFFDYTPRGKEEMPSIMTVYDKKSSTKFARLDIPFVTDKYRFTKLEDFDKEEFMFYVDLAGNKKTFPEDQNPRVRAYSWTPVNLKYRPDFFANIIEPRFHAYGLMQKLWIKEMKRQKAKLTKNDYIRMTTTNERFKLYLESYKNGKPITLTNWLKLGVMMPPTITGGFIFRFEQRLMNVFMKLVYGLTREFEDPAYLTLLDRFTHSTYAGKFMTTGRTQFKWFHLWRKSHVNHLIVNGIALSDIVSLQVGWNDPKTAFERYQDPSLKTPEQREEALAKAKENLIEQRKAFGLEGIDFDEELGKETLEEFVTDAEEEEESKSTEELAKQVKKQAKKAKKKKPKKAVERIKGEPVKRRVSK